MVNAFSVDELSGLLLNKFGYVEKEIRNLPKMEENIRKSEKFEEECGAEEIYMQGQMVASRIQPLKRYYSNPTEHNLLGRVPQEPLALQRMDELPQVQ